jgi:hypothetical protein
MKTVSLVCMQSSGGAGRFALLAYATIRSFNVRRPSYVGATPVLGIVNQQGVQSCFRHPLDYYAKLTRTILEE